MPPVQPNQPKVLLAGFLNNEADSISSALDGMGWSATVLSKETHIEAAFAAERFDVTVIDTEHLEVFAPRFIVRLRAVGGPSSDTTILAVDNTIFAGFKEQLAQAGADLVVPKPSDPKMYMINFTRAATFRLQSIGRHA